MRFIVRKSLPAFALNLTKEDVIHLKPDNWDDFGFKTTFAAVLHPKQEPNNVIDIGHVKILKKLQNTESSTHKILDSDELLEFEQLPTEYCSLGQDEDYYDKLADRGPEFANRFLTSLNDVHNNPQIGSEFENTANPGFETSLLRSSAAAALYVPLSKASSGSLSSDSSYHPRFNVSIRLQGAEEPHKIAFDFKKTNKLPNRTFVLVGKNGVGKTQILGRLAFLISGGATSQSLNRDEVYGEDQISDRGTFRNVIALSFSAFDSFETPIENEDARISYRYWGLKGADGNLLTTDELVERILKVWQKLTDRRKEILEEYLIYISPRLSIFDTTKRNPADTLKKKTSAGQRMMLATLTGLVSFLKTRSILLFDEPETHMHPAMLANLMSIISGLLEDFNSYAIISTHSPIVLQQVPSNYIRTIRRFEDRPEIDELPIETFGETLTEITQEIFDVNDYERDYKDTFISLLKENTPNEIIDMFNNRLSISARTLLYSLHKREEEH